MVMNREAVDSILQMIQRLAPQDRAALADEVDRISWRDRMQGVVGQYPRLSINAFNLWHIGNRQETGDTVPPGLLIRAASAGASRVEDDATWYLHLTWRRIGSLLFILTTAAVLSLYARRHTPDARALAAAGLGLAFFLFLTEMHERYAYPVIAILPIWAVTSAWRERVFVILCAMLLLNLAEAQPVDQIAGDIGAAKVILFVGLCAYLAFARDTTAGPSPAEPAPAPRPVAPPEPSRLVGAFRGGTLIAWIAAAGIAGTLIQLGVTAPDLETEDALYLSDLEPAVARQGYGQLARDAARWKAGRYTSEDTTTFAGWARTPRPRSSTKSHRGTIGSKPSSV